jgi:lipopolysaccharide transport system permease protein
MPMDNTENEPVIEKWDSILKPHSSVFDLQLSEIWRYRDLLLLFVKRDFSAQYKQTILGPLWHLIQPIFTTAIYLLLFGKIANIPTDGIPPILFYMSRIAMWNYFSACLTNTSNTFIANASIFGKVYFPRLILPISTVISNIVRLGIQFFLLFTAMMWFHLFKGFQLDVTFLWLWIPLLVLLLAGIGLGLGIIISSLTTKYRDFIVLMGFVVQLLMYMSPIGYPMSFIHNPKYRAIINLNPLSSIIEAFRYALFRRGNPNFSGLLYSSSYMVIVLFIGLLIFSKVEKTFMDSV